MAALRPFSPPLRRRVAAVPSTPHPLVLPRPQQQRQRRLASFYDLQRLGNSRATQHINRQSKLDRLHHAPHLEAIKSSEVDPFVKGEKGGKGVRVEDVKVVEELAKAEPASNSEAASKSSALGPSDPSVSTSPRTWDARNDALLDEQNMLRKQLNRMQRQPVQSNDAQVADLEARIRAIDSQLADVQRQEHAGEGRERSGDNAGSDTAERPGRSDAADTVIPTVIFLAASGVALVVVLATLPAALVDDVRGLPVGKPDERAKIMRNKYFAFLAAADEFETLSEGRWWVERQARAELQAAWLATRWSNSQQRELVDAAFGRIGELEKGWRMVESETRRKIKAVRGETEARANSGERGPAQSDYALDRKLLADFNSVLKHVDEYRGLRGESRAVASRLQTATEYAQLGDVPEERREAYLKAVAYLQGDEPTRPSEHAGVKDRTSAPDDKSGAEKPRTWAEMFEEAKQQAKEEVARKEEQRKKLEAARASGTKDAPEAQRKVYEEALALLDGAAGRSAEPKQQSWSAGWFWKRE